MRRILIVLAGVAVLALPLPASAGANAKQPSPGFFVVRNAQTDEGVNGPPVTIFVVSGFVLGRIAQEGEVEIYRLSGSSAAEASGVDLSRRHVMYRGVPGTEFSGSGFRFRAVGGAWRVVVYGAGISLYAGGQGSVRRLHGSTAYPTHDGTYSLDGSPFVSLPSGTTHGVFGGK